MSPQKIQHARARIVAPPGITLNFDATTQGVRWLQGTHSARPTAPVADLHDTNFLASGSVTRGPTPSTRLQFGHPQAQTGMMGTVLSDIGGRVGNVHRQT